MTLGTSERGENIDDFSSIPNFRFIIPCSPISVCSPDNNYYLSIFQAIASLVWMGVSSREPRKILAIVSVISTNSHSNYVFCTALHCHCFLLLCTVQHGLFFGLMGLIEPLSPSPHGYKPVFTRRSPPVSTLMIIAVLVCSFDYHKIDECNKISLSTLFVCNLHAL